MTAQEVDVTTIRGSQIMNQIVAKSGGGRVLSNLPAAVMYNLRGGNTSVMRVLK